MVLPIFGCLHVYLFDPYLAWRGSQDRLYAMYTKQKTKFPPLPKMHGRDS